MHIKQNYWFKRVKHKDKAPVQNVNETGSKLFQRQLLPINIETRKSTDRNIIKGKPQMVNGSNLWRTKDPRNIAIS
ncbi:unnamed protein product [Allacma fusca]|uniref:Uncharacterized protein n=1 Tax=Allacma fusca TaxID=39272 RepID=A0A8J2JR59_9HEXA|nr:unnamed protein product [Allacma fusca]